MLLPTVTKTLFRHDGTPKFIYYDSSGKHRKCCIILNIKSRHFSRTQKVHLIEGRIVDEIWDAVARDWLAALEIPQGTRNWQSAHAAFIASADKFIARHGIQTSTQRIFLKPQVTHGNS